jgi:methylated-DNA-[protein]-cysteine S-methyltransferase
MDSPHHFNINKLKFHSANAKLAKSEIMMTNFESLNQFQFPVNFGAISIRWSSEEKLQRIEWSENRLAVLQKVSVPRLLTDLVDQIRNFFYRGEPLVLFSWEMLDQSQWTEFQKRVYQTISKIPHGETRTYGWVAQRLGNGAASRAVGQALRKNPIPILIPCHRVISMSSIGGFMGESDPSQPEMKLKSQLLKLEEEYRSPIFPFLKPDLQRVDIRIGIL